MILIIDDDPRYTEMLEVALTAEGYKAESINDPRAAQDEIRSKMPELILSDIAMPQLDGYSLAAGLKADPITANIPLIFISAKRRPQNVNRMAEERSVGYLTKPFSVPQLLSEIRSLLDRQIEQ